MLVEIIGLLATLFTLLSFCVKGEAIIRLVNAVGCAFFIVYGIAIGALSVYLANSIILVLNVKRGLKLLKEDV